MSGSSLVKLVVVLVAISVVLVVMRGSFRQDLNRQNIERGLDARQPNQVEVPLRPGPAPTPGERTR